MKTMLAAFIFLAEWMFSAGAFAIDPGSASGSPMVEGASSHMVRDQTISGGIE